jgi:hypothetical protein
MALAALLCIPLLSPSLLSVQRNATTVNSALTYHPLLDLFFAVAVFLLCLAGELLLTQEGPQQGSHGGLLGWLRGRFSHFSWAVFSLSVYLVLIFILARLMFPARISLWGPLLEMSLAQTVGSGVAWIATVRREQTPAGGRNSGEA